MCEPVREWRKAAEEGKRVMQLKLIPFVGVSHMQREGEMMGPDSPADIFDS